eukprot:7015840-Pyramimonas_sp.AAC.1
MGLPRSFHVAVATLWGFTLGSEKQSRLHAMEPVHMDVEDSDTGVCNRSCDSLSRPSGNGSVKQMYIEGHSHSRLPSEPV